MGFTFARTGQITVEIEGVEYVGAVDSPEFIDFVRNNDYSVLADDSNPNQAADVVSYCVGLVTALFGPEASKAIFDGQRVTLLDCAALVGYIFQQIQDAGLETRLSQAAAKYGVGDVLR